MKKQQGVTLIELLMVIGIIALILISMLSFFKVDIQCHPEFFKY